MRIALVHELLTMRGGAERVLKVLADMFPDAPIYTLLYDESKLGDWFPKQRIHTSNLQNSLVTRYSLLATRSINHHLHLSRFPKAVEAWDFSQFDVVISSSSAFAHGIITNGAPKHLCYVQSPARYLWDRTHDVLEQAGQGVLGPLKRAYLSRLFHRLRLWDSEAADRPDMLLAASKEVQRRIQLYWRRDSQILYPPIDDAWLEEGPVGTGAMQQPEYFLIVSSLVRYKRIELAIEGCNTLGVHLKIVGEGPDAGRLKKLAGPTVEFYGWRSHDELRDLYARAKATMFPGDEDFGLVPLESMASGTPVIAYGKGGALETILPDKTGKFFSEPTALSLIEAIKKFESTSWSAEACKTQAKQFGRKRFEDGIRLALGKLTNA